MGNKNIGWIILAIVLLLIVINLKPQPTFIIYNGEEVEAEETEIQGQCWILGMSDTCVKQNVFLWNFTRQGLLVCPSGFFSTRLGCEKNYGLIVEEKPKINCYYTEKGECKVELFETEECPSQYFPTMDACTEKLETPTLHLQKLFTNPTTIVLIVIMGIVGLFLLIPKFT